MLPVFVGTVSDTAEVVLPQNDHKVVVGTPPTILLPLEGAPSTPHLKLAEPTVVLLQQGPTPVGWVGLMMNPNLPLDT